MNGAGARRTGKGRTGAGRAAWLIAVAWLGAAGGARAEDAPQGGPTATAEQAVLYPSAGGRIDVVARRGPEGARLAALAERAWGEWGGALGLPGRFSSPITARLAPEGEWGFAEPDWRTVAEPGGVVTIWIRGGGAGAGRDRRWLTALAEAVLTRRAIARGTALENVKAPAWLAAGAAEAVLVAEQAAQLDAWQAALRRAEDEPGGGLREVLTWKDAQGDGEGQGTRRAAAHGVWRWLRDEGGRGPAWERFTTALQAGEAPGAALAREYGRLTPRPAEAREWELVWRTAAARLARARTTPMLEAGETRRRIEGLARIVVLDTATGAERVERAGGGWETRGEVWLAAERMERAGLLAAEAGRMHPFYRNAAGSLGRAWLALGQGDRAGWEAEAAEFAADMAAGRELETASTRLLDEAEASRGEDGS